VYFKFPSKEKQKKDAKKKNGEGRKPQKTERGSRTLVNLKQNLDSVSPAYGFTPVGRV